MRQVFPTGVASTGVLTREMKRLLAAGPDSAVVSTETESVDASYARPEKVAFAAFLEAWEEPVKIPGRSKPASVYTAEIEVIHLADLAVVPERGRASRRLSRHVAVKAVFHGVSGGSDALVSVDVRTEAVKALMPDLVPLAGVPGTEIGRVDVSLAASEGVSAPILEMQAVKGESSSVAWPGVRFLPDITDLVALIGFLLRSAS